MLALDELERLNSAIALQINESDFFMRQILGIIVVR
jgi:hypothetical protein